MDLINLMNIYQNEIVYYLTLWVCYFLEMMQEIELLCDAIYILKYFSRGLYLIKEPIRDPLITKSTLYDYSHVRLRIYAWVTRFMFSATISKPLELKKVTYLFRKLKDISG